MGCQHTLITLCVPTCAQGSLTLSFSVLSAAAVCMCVCVAALPYTILNSTHLSCCCRWEITARRVSKAEYDTAVAETK